MVALSNHSRPHLPTLGKRPGRWIEGDGSPHFSPPLGASTGAILATSSADNAEKSTGEATGVAAVA